MEDGDCFCYSEFHAIAIIRQMQYDGYYFAYIYKSHSWNLVRSH